MKTHSIIQRNKAQGRKTWYLRTYDNATGATTFKSLKTEKKHEAAEMLRKIENRESESKEQREARKFDGLTLDATAAEYIHRYELENASAHTITGVKSTLKLFKEFCKGRNIDRINELTPQLITVYFTQMEAGANTKRKRHQILKTFYKWLLEFYDIERKNIFSKVRPPRAESSNRFFWTTEQVDQILNATTDPQRRLFYALMAFEGLRYFEARGLSWEQVKADQIEVTGKGRKFAKIPLSERMKVEFLRAGGRKESGTIFSTIRTNGRENEILQRTCKAIFLEDGTPLHVHRFRHSFGSNLLKAGVNVVTVAKLMRHENANITLKFYAHVLNEDLTNAINKL